MTHWIFNTFKTYFRVGFFLSLICVFRYKNIDRKAKTSIGIDTESIAFLASPLFYWCSPDRTDRIGFF